MNQRPAPANTLYLLLLSGSVTLSGYSGLYTQESPSSAQQGTGAEPDGLCQANPAPLTLSHCPAGDPALGEPGPAYSQASPGQGSCPRIRGLVICGSELSEAVLGMPPRSPGHRRPQRPRISSGAFSTAFSVCPCPDAAAVCLLLARQTLPTPHSSPPTLRHPPSHLCSHADPQPKSPGASASRLWPRGR